MFERNDSADDHDLPWDPMWEYVLGEDEMDIRDDHDRRSLFEYREERRDFQSGEATNAVCGSSILKTLFQRRKGNTSSSTVLQNNVRASAREEWQWELDTSPFVLSNNSSKPKDQKGNDKAPWSNKRSQDSSWIRSIWRDQSARQHSSSFRKPS